MEKRMIIPPGGPSGPYYGVMSHPSGRVVALHISDQVEAERIVCIPELIEKLEWALDLIDLYDRRLVTIDDASEYPEGYDEEAVHMDAHATAMRQARLLLRQVK